MEQKTPSLVYIRTYERGVEAETRACGTGSVASAIISFLKLNPDVKKKTGAMMNVKTQSNEILNVTFDLSGKKISNVWLTGSANFIAEGKLFLKT